MKSFKNVKQAAQGDVAITRVDNLPEGMELNKFEHGVHVVAHSETGHHHVIDASVAEMHNDPSNGLVSYLVVEDTAQLTHTRTYDTHETIELDKGVYRINRQREYTPEGYRRVAD